MTGSPIWKVIGSSMAMVAVAPMPGSTPISVPSSTPIRQKPRLVSVDGGGEAEREIVEEFHRALLRASEPGTEQPERQAEPVA